MLTGMMGADRQTDGQTDRQTDGQTQVTTITLRPKRPRVKNVLRNPMSQIFMSGGDKDK